MARTAEQNQKLMDDYKAAFHAANPDIDYELSLSYLPGGYVVIRQGTYRSTYRPGKVEQMIERLKARVK